MARVSTFPNVKRWDVLCCPFRAHISEDMVTLGRCPRLNCTALSGRKTGSHCRYGSYYITLIIEFSGEACLARKKHIITCSGVPWRAVIEPHRMEAVGIVSLVKRWADNQKQRAQPESHARCA